MKITYILKDLTAAFFDGNGLPPEHVCCITGLNNLLTNRARLAYLDSSWCNTLKITAKVGSGSFRDRVELNTFLRSNPCSEPSYKLEPRKGYRLATFEFNF